MNRTRFAQLAALMLAAGLFAACGENMDADAGPDDGDVATPDTGTVRVDSGVDAGPPPTDAGPTGCQADCEYVEINVGALHVCGRRENGEVLCWGRNEERQLGDNRSRHDDCADVGSPMRDCTSTPVNARFLSGGTRAPFDDAVGLAVDGFSSSCAIREGGSLWCWSNETVPETAGGIQEERPVAEQETAFSMVTAAAASGGHLCVVEGSTGAVRCFGSNTRGQLGSGSFDELVIDPVDVRVPDMGVVAVLDAGMPDGGAMLDAGVGTDGGAGMDAGMILVDAGTDAGAMMDSDAGFSTTALTGGIEVSLGGSFTCARTATDVYCWGRNQDDQLGDGASTQHVECIEGLMDRFDCSPFAVQVGGAEGGRLGTTTDIDVGSAHACAVRDGEVYCWGDNRFGQAGQNTDFETAGLPSQVGVFDDAIQVAAGSSHTCALHDDGTISCWGSNLEFQLGDGLASHGETCVAGATNADCSRVAVDVAVIDDATYIAANAATTCAIREGGSVWCWGYNTDRQLGDGTRENRSMPVMVMGTP